MRNMIDKEYVMLKTREGLQKIERNAGELLYLKQVAEDLRTFRRMIKLKKYD